MLRVFPKQWPFSSNAIGNIQFTSGTTGMPKAAALSHYNLVNNGISVNMHCNRIIDNWNTDSTICNVLPLYHVFGFVAGSICGAIMNASRNGILIQSSGSLKLWPYAFENLLFLAIKPFSCSRTVNYTCDSTGGIMKCPKKHVKEEFIMWWHMHFFEMPQNRKCSFSIHFLFSESKGKNGAFQKKRA